MLISCLRFWSLSSRLGRFCCG